MSELSQFHYVITGPENGRRWVFIHGLMGFLNNWRKVVSLIEPTERCLAYDQRGHGRSFKPATGYAAEDYADDLKYILDELGWDKIILVGHSMGGRNVLNFASRYPERVEKLVIEDIGPGPNSNAVDYYEKLLGVVPTPFANREVARTFFKSTFQQLAAARDRVEVLAQYFYANIEDKADGTASWRFSKEGVLETVRSSHIKDQWNELRGLQMPVLLIRGQDSRELSPGVYAEMLACNKMIKGVEIANSGHWVHADQPAEFVLALKDFAGGFEG